MHTLRARLVVGLLALAAVGLLALAGITYAEQRSFLLDRVDQQLRDAGPQLAHALAEQGVGRAPGPGGPGSLGGRAPGGGAPPAPAPTLPPGTWGARLDADGEQVGRPVVVVYGESAATPPQPRLPATLERDATFTSGAREGDVDFRVRVLGDPVGGGSIVAAIPLTDVDQTLDRLLLVEGLVIAGVLIALGVGAWLLVRVGLLPLDRMTHTAGRIAGGDLSQRVEATDPRSEAGRLGVAFNGMLDRLEVAFDQRRRSEERLRRFLADASHELRTPLASIRGYAELFRIGAARSPEETEKAMRRIEEEAARMGVLVEDLLALARLDEVREAEHGPVDLVPLARDAVDDARAAAPARRIELHAPQAGGAVVDGNAHQLRQVLANLLRNALVHTPDGTPVEVTVEPARGAGEPPPGGSLWADDPRSGPEPAELTPRTVRLSVRDHGPGLPTDDPGELFERFWRDERGRARGQGGAGLGLAIVAGIVGSHGGTVTAADAPGGGALFTVELPA
ncbi:sensor histidine kinase [Conexibacter arvalis]|uniref:histidine kinase n=1 Tax=Conexibacter arvalis TaxID=912552 RepID=A0A840IID8_9ACTN|nr:HAMP domain-containing sensor histidine kinase [Conexibacter arvalis]MBB4664536.1 two-component system OmpR family sensor kinase [Conexibacter arvalis]